MNTSRSEVCLFGTLSIALLGPSAIPVYEARGQVLINTETVKRQSDDPRQLAYHGYAVAIDGDLAVVGEPRKIEQTLQTGAAFILARDQGGAGQWGIVKKLLADDAASRDLFGRAVAISGDTVVIGAPWDDVGFNSDPGAAYVFRRNAGGPDQWGQVAMLSGTGTALDNFGMSAAIDGDRILVGAPDDEDGPGSDFGAAYLYERDLGGAENWGLRTKLQASDRGPEDHFGGNVLGADFGSTGVSLSGDIAVVGAAFNDDDGTDSGSAYLFARNEGGADQWGELRKLTASDAQAGSHFGTSVAASGNTIVVGARDHDIHAFSPTQKHGAVYLFERDQGGADQWGESTKLTAFEAGSFDFFGTVVAIDADRILVGAPGDDHHAQDAGSAYFYHRNQGGAGQWGLERILRSSDGQGDDAFGEALDLSGPVCVVGSPDKPSPSGNGTGCAYMYDTSLPAQRLDIRPDAAYAKGSGIIPIWPTVSGDGSEITGYTLVPLLPTGLHFDPISGQISGSPQMTLPATLFTLSALLPGGSLSTEFILGVVPEAEAEFHDSPFFVSSFGEVAAIDGDWAVAGDWRDEEAGRSAGAAFVYQRSTNGWVQVRKLIGLDTAPFDFFGHAVDIDGERVAVAAVLENAVYIFERNAGGADAWGQVAKLGAGSVGNRRLGQSISLSGDLLLAGAPLDDGPASGDGAAYVFARDQGGAGHWGLVTGLVNPTAAAGDRFGGAVSLDGNVAAVSAPGSDTTETNAGAVIIFERNRGGADNWGAREQVQAPVPEEGAFFGDIHPQAIALDGDILAVGDYNQDMEAGLHTGTAYVFQFNGSQWNFARQLGASDTAPQDQFGWAVAVDGTRIVVGVNDTNGRLASGGACYVFEQDTGGTGQWGQLIKFIAGEAHPSSNLGFSVDISGLTVLGADIGNDALHFFDIPLPPSSLAYAANPASYRLLDPIADNPPIVGAIPLTGFSITPALPDGLQLDPMSGLLRGTPAVTAPSAAYTVSANNISGFVQVALDLEVLAVLTARDDALSRHPQLGVQIGKAVLMINDNGEAGGALDITAVSSPTANGATVTIAGATVEYLPNGHAGPDAFTYTLSETGVGSTNATVTVAIDPPVNELASTRIEPLPEGAWRVHFSGDEGYPYRIEYTPTLVPPSWTVIGTATGDAAGQLFIDHQSADGTGYYRAVFP